jgi:serine/threonine protein kinase
MIERFGRFRLHERIGAGGMGEVFRAVVDGEAGFQRPLAIKRLHPLLSRDAGFVRAFLDEARLAARLHHPGIVQVYELGRVGEHYFLAMELVEGIDLGRLGAALRRRREPLDVGVACFIASEVAAALDYAHALDDGGRPLELVHRDVSPANVMVSAAGAVKLLDFGVAKVSARIADEHTRTGVIKGKAGYLSPEQADGRPIDRRSDLFSLGVVLYELLAARRLFHGIDDLDALRQVRAAVIPAVPSLPPDVDVALRRLLARAPGERFARGAEVVDALSPAVHRAAGDAYTLGRAVLALADEAAAPPAAGPPTMSAPPRRRWPWSRWR